MYVTFGLSLMHLDCLNQAKEQFQESDDESDDRSDAQEKVTEGEFLHHWFVMAKMFLCHAFDTGAGILQETMLKLLGKKKDLEHINIEKEVKKAGLDNMLPIEVILVEMSIL